MSNPILGYLDPDFFKILDEVRESLKNLYRTKDHAFALSGSGSSGMEAGLTCLAERGDKVIICAYGYFCERQILMAERLGLEIIPLRSEWGKQMDPSLLEDALKQHPDTKLVVATHAETSTGVLQNIEELGKIVSKSNALLDSTVVFVIERVFSPSDIRGIIIPRKNINIFFIQWFSRISTL